METKKGKRALILSGGSAKGAFQAGALSVVLKRIQPDAIYGISVGSLNGAFLVHQANRWNLPPHRIPWERIGEELVEFWLHKIRSPKDLISPRGLLANGTKIIFNNWDGLNRNEPLKRLLHETVSASVLNDGPVQLFVGVVNLQSGMKEYYHHGPDFLDYILASAAIPFIMPTSLIADTGLVKQAYLDGGLRDSSPISQAIANGVESVFCIYCHPEQIDAVPELQYRQVKRYANRVMDIISHENIMNDHRTSMLLNDLVQAKGESDYLGKGSKQRFVKGLENIIRPRAQLPIDIEDFSSRDVYKIIQLGVDAAENFFFMNPKFVF